jgi:phenylalanyl-tRNA synthetase beta chain
MKVSTHWLKDYVSFKGSCEELAERLTQAGLEVKGLEPFAESGDTVMEIEITSNRPDWLSHVGVAREVSSVAGVRLTLPEFKNPPVRVGAKDLTVEIQDPVLCPYYSACLLEDFEFGESPAFMRERLLAVGMRPISLAVDVTNYVLLETGQPLHAFDWNKLADSKLLIRRAKDQEKIRTIDGNEYSLNRDDLVIATPRHPVAIAGVMGGLASEVGSSTRAILLESAYFQPVSVRRTSKKLGLSSDSSYRFERGVDPRGVDDGRERAVYLIRKYARRAGRVSPVYKAGRPPVKEPVIQFPLAEVSRVLGLEIPAPRIARYLRALGLSVKTASRGKLTVKVPSFRQDLFRPCDLVEEVARIHGYDRIPEKMPLLEPAYAPVPALYGLERNIRRVLTGAGFYETVTFSLINGKIFEKLGVPLEERVTRIVNPQNKDLDLMRPTLMPSLLEVIKTNFYHGASDIRIFELANVYGAESGKSLPSEEPTVALALAGTREPHWQEKGRPYTIFDLKGICETLFQAAGLPDRDYSETQNPFFSRGYAFSTDGQCFGILGEISAPAKDHYDFAHPVFVAEFSLASVGRALPGDCKFAPLPKYPSSYRDMALVLDELVRAGDIQSLIGSLNFPYIRKVEVLDLYRGGQIPAGKKSLAFSVEYRADDHTLTAEEIGGVHERVVNAVKEKFGAVLRS